MTEATIERIPEAKIQPKTPSKLIKELEAVLGPKLTSPEEIQQIQNSEEAQLRAEENSRVKQLQQELVRYENYLSPEKRAEYDQRLELIAKKTPEEISKTEIEELKTLADELPSEVIRVKGLHRIISLRELKIEPDEQKLFGQLNQAVLGEKPPETETPGIPHEQLGPEREMDLEEEIEEVESEPQLVEKEAKSLEQYDHWEDMETTISLEDYLQRPEARSHLDAVREFIESLKQAEEIKSLISTAKTELEQAGEVFPETVADDLILIKLLQDRIKHTSYYEAEKANDPLRQTFSKIRTETPKTRFDQGDWLMTLDYLNYEIKSQHNQKVLTEFRQKPRPSRREIQPTIGKHDERLIRIDEPVSLMKAERAGIGDNFLKDYQILQTVKSHLMPPELKRRIVQLREGQLSEEGSPQEQLQKAIQESYDFDRKLVLALEFADPESLKAAVQTEAPNQPKLFDEVISLREKFETLEDRIYAESFEKVALEYEGLTPEETERVKKAIKRRLETRIKSVDPGEIKHRCFKILQNRLWREMYLPLKELVEEVPPELHEKKLVQVPEKKPRPAEVLPAEYEPYEPVTPVPEKPPEEKLPEAEYEAVAPYEPGTEEELKTEEILSQLRGMKVAVASLDALAVAARNLATQRLERRPKTEERLSLIERAKRGVSNIVKHNWFREFCLELERQKALKEVTAAGTPLLTEATIDEARNRAKQDVQQHYRGFRKIFRPITKATDAFKVMTGHSSELHQSTLSHLEKMRESGEIQELQTTEEAYNSLIERFVQEHERWLEGDEKYETLNPEISEEKEVLDTIHGWIRDYVKGEISEQELRETANRAFYEWNIAGIKPEVFERGQFYATSLIETAETIRAHLEHAAGITALGEDLEKTVREAKLDKTLDEILESLEVRLGTGAWGPRTQTQKTTTEKVLEGIKSEKTRKTLERFGPAGQFVINTLANEATLATAVSLAVSAATTAPITSVSSKGRTAVSTTVGGVIAGPIGAIAAPVISGGITAFATAYIKEKGRRVGERKQIAAEAELGLGIAEETITPNRAWFAEFIPHQPMAQKCIEDTEKYFESPQAETPILKLESEQDLLDLLGTIASVKARQKISLDKKIGLGLIRFSSQEAQQQERTQLNKTLDKAERALAEFAQKTENKTFLNQTIIKEALGEKTIQEFLHGENGLTATIEVGLKTELENLDKRFKKEANKVAAKTGVKAAVVGAALGYTFYELAHAGQTVQELSTGDVPDTMTPLQWLIAESKNLLKKIDPLKDASIGLNPLHLPEDVNVVWDGQHWDLVLKDGTKVEDVWLQTGELADGATERLAEAGLALELPKPISLLQTNKKFAVGNSSWQAPQEMEVGDFDQDGLVDDIKVVINGKEVIIPDTVDSQTGLPTPAGEARLEQNYGFKVDIDASGGETIISGEVLNAHNTVQVGVDSHGHPVFARLQIPKEGQLLDTDSDGIVDQLALENNKINLRWDEQGNLTNRDEVYRQLSRAGYNPEKVALDGVGQFEGETVSGTASTNEFLENPRGLPENTEVVDVKRAWWYHNDTPPEINPTTGEVIHYHSDLNELRIHWRVEGDNVVVDIGAMTKDGSFATLGAGDPAAANWSGLARNEQLGLAFSLSKDTTATPVIVPITETGELEFNTSDPFWGQIFSIGPNGKPVLHARFMEVVERLSPEKVATKGVPTPPSGVNPIAPLATVSGSGLDEIVVETPTTINAPTFIIDLAEKLTPKTAEVIIAPPSITEFTISQLPVIKEVRGPFVTPIIGREGIEKPPEKPSPPEAGPATELEAEAVVPTSPRKEIEPLSKEEPTLPPKPKEKVEAEVSPPPKTAPSAVISKSPKKVKEKPTPPLKVEAEAITPTPPIEKKTKVRIPTSPKEVGATRKSSAPGIPPVEAAPAATEVEAEAVVPTSPRKEVEPLSKEEPTLPPKPLERIIELEPETVEWLLEKERKPIDELSPEFAHFVAEKLKYLTKFFRRLSQDEVKQLLETVSSKPELQAALRSISISISTQEYSRKSDALKKLINLVPEQIKKEQEKLVIAQKRRKMSVFDPRFKEEFNGQIEWEQIELESLPGKATGIVALPNGEQIKIQTYRIGGESTKLTKDSLGALQSKGVDAKYPFLSGTTVWASGNEEIFSRWANVRYTTLDGKQRKFTITRGKDGFLDLDSIKTLEKHGFSDEFVGPYHYPPEERFEPVDYSEKEIQQIQKHIGKLHRLEQEQARIINTIQECHDIVDEPTNELNNTLENIIRKLRIELSLEDYPLCRYVNEDGEDSFSNLQGIMLLLGFPLFIDKKMLREIKSPELRRKVIQVQKKVTLKDQMAIARETDVEFANGIALGADLVLTEHEIGDELINLKRKLEKEGWRAPEKIRQELATLASQRRKEWKPWEGLKERPLDYITPIEEKTEVSLGDPEISPLSALSQLQKIKEQLAIFDEKLVAPLMERLKPNVGGKLSEPLLRKIIISNCLAFAYGRVPNGENIKTLSEFIRGGGIPENISDWLSRQEAETSDPETTATMTNAAREIIRNFNLGPTKLKPIIDTLLAYPDQVIEEALKLTKYDLLFQPSSSTTV
jgi:hypothetical protein